MHWIIDGIIEKYSLLRVQDLPIQWLSRVHEVQDSGGIHYTDGVPSLRTEITWVVLEESEPG